MGTQGTNISSLFLLSGDLYEIPEVEDHLDSRLEFSFSRYPQQKHHDRRLSKAPVATQTYPARY